jgi:predicted dehydrogenase
MRKSKRSDAKEPFMANKRISVGMIIHPEGAHLGAYFEALAKTEEVDSVYVADPTGETEPRAKELLGDKFQKLFRDPNVMLQQAGPNMALVSLEASQAPPAIDAALDAGCHVLSEKPACVRVEDFERLARKADGKHRFLMLALANRSTPPVREARRLVRTGQFGKIYGIEMHIIADQTRLKNESYHKTWYADKSRAGGGHLIWLGIHWLDLVHFITGLNVTEVTGMIQNVGGQPITVEDSATVVMRYDNGSAGTLTSAYYIDKGYHMHVKIWCENGWLELADLDTDPLVYYSNREAKVRRFDYPAGQRGYTPFVRSAVRASAGLEEAPITATEGLRVLQTIFAAYRSAETGVRQKLS